MLNPTWRVLIVLVVCAGASTLLSAQITVVPGSRIRVLNPAAASEGATVDSEPASAPGDQEAPEGEVKKPAPKSPRVQRLLRCTFDRRPSTILRTWSDLTSKTPAGGETSPNAPAVVEGSGNEDVLVISESMETESEFVENGESPPAEAQGVEKADGFVPAEAAKVKGKPDPKEIAAIEAEAKLFERRVTLGEWDAIRIYLGSLPPGEGEEVYKHLLNGLKNPPRPTEPQSPESQRAPEKNRFTAEDMVGLLMVSPTTIARAETKSAGKILRLTLDLGVDVLAFTKLAKAEMARAGSRVDARAMARILTAANEFEAAEAFLPEVQAAIQENDREALNLITRVALSAYQKSPRQAHLEKAWAATQAALEAGKIAEEDKLEALKLAVELAPKIKKELGATWLADSFKKQPERGREILATIGAASAGGLAKHWSDAAARKRLLELQANAVEALLEAAPERAAEWRIPLAVLAQNWLTEAVHSQRYDRSSSLGPQMRRDVYGNFYYLGSFDGEEEGEVRTPQGAPAAIAASDLLDLRPKDAWLVHVEPGLRSKFSTLCAQLYLRVGEENRAFPFIEAIATENPKAAKTLVDEFLRVWAKNHDPNASQQRQNPYIYMYGFEERANGIPLTRSKQDRNLKELAGWTERLRKLPVEIDQALVAKAFAAAHSIAEIYRLETIETVLGPIKSLDPSTLATMMDTMRSNLLTLWRNPKVQEVANTKRKKRDIEREVLRGYEIAGGLLDEACGKHPTEWRLALARAALTHDLINYFDELQKSAEFVPNRIATLGEFAKAADLYLKTLPSLEPEKESTSVFELWFYAALGACDLRALRQEQGLASSEIPKIREALINLPVDRRERHLAKFAGTLFSRMGSVPPNVKFRYAREGLEIVGDHRLAAETKKIFDYYRDLVTEIKLETAIDGSDQVGHQQPFGVHVRLRHTTGIERESGGFSKYLVNQNQGRISWNYGRPPEDYRRKFEETVREALHEHFEVLSVTFNHAEAQSLASETDGWRITPYAYLLLKSKGPEVDRVPSLRFDLDFLDTSGYAVLPVESAVLPIDSKVVATTKRPFEKLKVVQTLDERRARDGKLLLEVKASALGLVPELESVVSATAPGFDLDQVSDSKVSISSFDEASQGASIVAERTWNLTYVAAKAAVRPAAFEFPAVVDKGTAVERFRYKDADLVSVGSRVDLEASYGSSSRSWIAWTASLVGIAVLAGFLLYRATRSQRSDSSAPSNIPAHLTPFSLLGFLRSLERKDHLSQETRAALAAEISKIEAHFFGSPEGAAPDLANIAQTWSARISPSRIAEL